MEPISNTQSVDEDKRTNPMRDQIVATAPALKAMYWELETKARLLLTTPEIFSVRRIVLSGCGDSRMAGQSAEMAFEKYAGIPTETQRAMDASRYAAQLALDNSPNNPLVILISSSGDVARVVEAAQQYSSNGARTVAITSQTESRLAQSAGLLFPFVAPSLPPAPGFFSYAAALTMLYLLAIRIGEVKGRLTQSQAHEKRNELAHHIDDLDETVKSADDTAYRLAQSWQGLSHFEFLGSGPGYGVASFGAAKIMEAAGAFAWQQGIEEWAHLQYFLAKPETVGTFIIAPPGSVASSRALEVARLVKRRESPFAVVSGDPIFFECDKQRVFQIPDTIPEEFSPLLCSASLALFASYLAEFTGASYGRGHVGRWVDSNEGNAVRNSELFPVRA